MPPDPPPRSGGPGDSAPSWTTSRLQRMIVDDPLLAAFARTRWPSRRPRAGIALALAAPLTWMLAGYTAVAAVSVIVITALLLAAAWMWSRGEGREARTFLLLSRWTIVGFVWLGCLTALTTAPGEQRSPAASQPAQSPPAASQQAVPPATHVGVVPYRR